MFFKISIPPRDDAERAAIAAHRRAMIPEPVYGGQLQNFATPGLRAEGEMVVAYEEVPVQLTDGETVSLRKPTYGVRDLGFGPLDAMAMLSPRVAPTMLGMGFIEAIPERDILALADPDDRNGDGISGRPSWVWSLSDEAVRLGRFGWKAGAPSVAQQSAMAFSGDMGLSTPLIPGSSADCTTAQVDCGAATHGEDEIEGTEVTQQMFDLVVFYARNLAVPARRDVDDPEVLEGKRLFYESGCTGCHRPKFVTGRETPGVEQSFQLVWPYSDFLLHDMGEGLADGRPEGAASGREWRTPPLWGIGLTAEVSGHTYFLHDGRARSLLEAVLWHGGEAQESRDRIVAMSKEGRARLIRFLESL